MRPNRVAVVCDLREENWPSMDLVGEMLLQHLQKDFADTIAASRVCPPMRRRFSGSHNGNGKFFNADRVLNRFVDYPGFIRRRRQEFDVFHIIDHSYSQLVLELPAEKTVVTCHDLDTFRCLLDPEQEPRSIFFRKMMERTLSGFRRAARVACVSAATRDELLAFNLISPDRVVVIPNGVHPAFSLTPNPQADVAATKMLGAPTGHKFDILHVGSTIPRKRINDLLCIFALVKQTFPASRLIRGGGDFTEDQTKLVEQLNLRETIVILPRLSSEVLAAVYRRAALVLQPSEREGFGLPVVEALACGVPVIASDLAVLREVGGDAVNYCPVGDVAAWAELSIKLLHQKRDEPDQSAQKQQGFKQAAKFTWAEYTRKVVDLYRQLI